MKKFTREEIDEWRETFIERKYPQREANLDGRRVDYFVVPADLFQGVPNGLFRMTGDAQDGYIVGVSAEVPLEIQSHFAVSEHDEFMVSGLDDLDRTLHSEQNIMHILGRSELGKIYVPNKLRLYDYMIENAKGNLDSWIFTEDDFAGFVKAANYLRSEL